jgi:type IV pilus assembly protein PilE
MQYRHQGFTLLELMIVAAVIGILGALAYPGYAEYLRRGHRADARAGLLQAQQWLERAATATGVYPTSLPAALAWSGEGGKRYTLGFAAGNTGTAYTLTATPRGAQAGDRCGIYTLSHAGLRGANGKTSGQAGYDTDCWSR